MRCSEIPLPDKISLWSCNVGSERTIQEFEHIDLQKMMWYIFVLQMVVLPRLLRNDETVRRFRFPRYRWDSFEKFFGTFDDTIHCIVVV